MIQRFMVPPSHSKLMSLSLLILRVVVGIAFIMHGFSKIQNPMGWMGPESGIPGILQLLAAVSEFGGGIALILGLLTPLAALGILSTMVVATSLHAVIEKHPFVAMGGPSYELPLVYLCISFLIFAAGPGWYSLDQMLFKKSGKKN